MKRRIIIVLSILCHAITGLAQDLDAVESKVRAFSFKKGIRMSGSLSFNTISYMANGTAARRDPFNWYANSNLTLNVFGLDVPFSFSYTNARLSYTQPFNRIRFSPKYKWVKTHIGTSNMNFSSYTLAGHQFKGYGLELTPKKWRFMAMYGTLKEPVPYPDARSGSTNTTASFKRVGYGFKGGYESNGEVIEAIFFRAKDDPLSIPFIPVGGLITPKENVVLGISGKKKIGKRVFIDMEYAISGLTADLRSDTAKMIAKNYSLLARYIKTRNTTRFYDAANFGVGYTGNTYAIQLKYERVAPEYQTLGAYYFNSDLENYTIMPSFRLFAGKVNFSGNLGLQRDNLDGQKTATSKRFVGNMNVNIIPNEQWNLAGTYSNFSSYTNVRPQADPFYQNTFDTLNFYQVNQTFNSMVGYNFGNRQYRHMLMLNASFQRANDQASETGRKSLSDFYSGNFTWTTSITEKNINISSGFSYNKNTAAGTNSVFMGPTFSLNNDLFKKLIKNTVSLAYNKSMSNGIVNNDLLNLRWSLQFAPVKKEAAARQSPKGAAPPVTAASARLPAGNSKPIKEKQKLITGHSAVFSLNYTTRFKNSVLKKSMRELTINAGYVFNFR